jgi:transposase-like protein
MTQGLNQQVVAFPTRSLSDEAYLDLWIDSLYKKVRYSGRVISMTILLILWH